MDGLAEKRSDDNVKFYFYKEQEKVKSHDHPNTEEKRDVNEYGEDEDY